LVIYQESLPRTPSHVQTPPLKFVALFHKGGLPASNLKNGSPLAFIDNSAVDELRKTIQKSVCYK
jgi:hypothetical protein